MWISHPTKYFCCCYYFINANGYTNNISYGYGVETNSDGSLVETGEVKTYTSKVGNTTNTYTYTYDGRGNITSLTLNDVLQYTYWYDNLGQLTNYEDHINKISYYYEYDDSGNILFYEEYDLEYEYTIYQYWNEYDGDRLTSCDYEAVTYDEYGRTSSYRGKNIYYAGYNAHNISDFGNASFTYYEDGMRRTKTVGGVTHYYTYEGINLIKEEWNGNVMLFLYDADGSVIGMQYRNSSYASGLWDTYYYEKNLQGDIVAVYNTSGTKLVSYEYNPWGDFTRTDLASNVPDVVKNNPITYRGYYYDDDLDLYYLATRYYDPETCRFVTQDSALYHNMLGYNMFVYCNNNPVNYVDYTGESPELAAGWAATMWWLHFVDGPLPLGDIIYWGVLGALGTFIVAGGIYLVESSSETDSNKDTPKSLDDVKSEGNDVKNEGDRKLPTTDKPNSDRHLHDKNGLKQTRHYGPDGKAEYDIDYHHPGKNHKFPHKHKWSWNDNIPVREGPIELGGIK